MTRRVLIPSAPASDSGPQDLQTGTERAVYGVDNIAILMYWDNGSSLKLFPDTDSFKFKLKTRP